MFVLFIKAQPGTEVPGCQELRPENPSVELLVFTSGAQNDLHNRTFTRR